MKKEKTELRSVFDSTSTKGAGTTEEKKDTRVNKPEYVFVTVKMEKSINTELKIFCVNNKPMWETIQDAVVEHMKRNK